jgi:hypothetical protein
MDHDQRFKEMLRQFFREFIALFFPEWVERIEFDSLEWLMQEVFPDPPQGERYAIDLLAKVRVRRPPSDNVAEPQPWLALIHVEVEAKDRVAPLRQRMFEYYEFLEQGHGLQVLPIALYLQVGLNGVGWDVYEEWFWEHRLVHFEYAYVGLPALDAWQYLEGANWLGVAPSALMRVPEERKAELKAVALRRLVASPLNEQQRYLLCECVDTYLPLHGPQLDEFQRLLLTERTMHPHMTGTIFGQGMAQGQRELLQELLEQRFGPLSPQVIERLSAWPPERLRELGKALLTARSLQELGLEDANA